MSSHQVSSWEYVLALPPALRLLASVLTASAPFHTVLFAMHLIPAFCSLFQDAHNCIPELDSETAMFSVYDGHGGNCTPAPPGVLCCGCLVKVASGVAAGASVCLAVEILLLLGKHFVT